MNNYCKLYAKILDSTIWNEPAATRLVWITMLAMKDWEGFVDSSVPGLANRARVTIPECEEALETFLSPDSYSRTKDNDGRRIRAVDGGWIVLNHFRYRDDVEEAREKNRKRQERWRKKQGKQKQWYGPPKTSEEKLAEDRQKQSNGHPREPFSPDYDEDSGGVSL